MDKKHQDIALIETAPFQWQNSVRRRGKNSGLIRIYASSEFLGKARQDGSLSQVFNVSRLPGLVGASLAMPDIHTGYGFCIGAVAAFSEDDGIVSPGGVGYDINCGVSLIATSLVRSELKTADLSALGKALLAQIPSGLMSPSRHPQSKQEMEEILQTGALAIARRYTRDVHPLLRIERGGALPVTDIGTVSDKALQRGQGQLGTLGSGNHFLEIQHLAEILDRDRADALGLKEGAVTILLHSGSRGLGHQVASDYLALFQRKGIQTAASLADPQLISAPASSVLARRYLDAHNAAANFAWANRQVLIHDIVTVFETTLQVSKQALAAQLVTDHSHNLASWEKHPQHPNCRLLVHRKGATRALPPGHSALPDPFRTWGQAVMLPGSMGASTYLLCGTAGSEHSWHSCPHGAGRSLSRRAAIAFNSREKALDRLKDKGILLYCHSREGLAEEIPQAYKPIEEVLNITSTCKLALPVARFEPLMVVKG